MPGERLDENIMAMRAAREFQDGMLVNLGVGIPTLASSWVLPDREVLNSLANKLIQPDNMAIVIVGDEATIREELEANRVSSNTWA